MFAVKIRSLGNRLNGLISKIEDIQSKKRKSKFQKKQKESLRNLFFVFNIDNKKVNFHFWFGLFKMIQIKSSINHSNHTSLIVKKSNNVFSKKRNINNLKVHLMTYAYNLGLANKILKSMYPTNQKSDKIWFQNDSFFTSFENLFSFVLKCRGYQLTNVKVYTLYVLLRFLHFFRCLFFLNSQSLQRNQKFINNILVIMEKFESCSHFFSEMKSLYSNNSTDQKKKIIYISFLDYPQQSFPLEDDLILKLLEERKKLPLKSLDLDDFELLEKSVDDF